MKVVSSLKTRYDLAAGIGDRWDDRERHLESDGQSFILREYFPNWDTAKNICLAHHGTLFPHCLFVAGLSGRKTPKHFRSIILYYTIHS